jgi:DNA-binding NarL/FixJ family response regulator
MTGVTRILLVDDHTFICELLTTVLSRSARWEVVGAVRDARRAVETARCLQPDLLVLDIEMPGLSVFEALKTIRREQPGIKAVFLSAYLSDHYISQALACEAKAFVAKDEPLEALVDAVTRVADGGSYFSPAVRTRLVVGPRGVSLAARSRSRAETLTPRELEILCYIAQGLAKKEIAELLYISPKTVDQHCCHLMAKLDIHDRVHLTRYAIREGLVHV